MSSKTSHKPSNPSWPSQQSLDDIRALFEALGPIQASEDGPYTFLDEQRDFLAVFNGDSTAEQGRRVLSIIASICEGPPVSIHEVSDHARLAWRYATRSVMQDITLRMAGRRGIVKIEKQNEEEYV